MVKFEYKDEGVNQIPQDISDRERLKKRISGSILYRGVWLIAVTALYDWGYFVRFNCSSLGCNSNVPSKKD